MDTKKPRFSVSVDADLYDKINKYQHEQRINSQTQAIAAILKIGIEAIMEEGDMGIAPEVSPEPAISEQLARIIEIFNEMNTVGQDKLYEYAEDLIVNSRYKKDNPLAKKSAG